MNFLVGQEGRELGVKGEVGEHHHLFGKVGPEGEQHYSTEGARDLTKTERERDGERETETQRHRERETDRERQRHRERDRQRETETQRERETDRERQRHRERFPYLRFLYMLLCMGIPLS